MSDLYRQQILDAAEHPQNQGRLPQADFSSQVTNASCGDEIAVWIKLDAQQRVDQIGWEGAGCVISQAAISEVSQLIVGKTIDQIQALAEDDVLDALGLTQISPGRQKCLMLGLKAVQTAFVKED